MYQLLTKYSLCILLITLLNLSCLVLGLTHNIYLRKIFQTSKSLTDLKSELFKQNEEITKPISRESHRFFNVSVRYGINYIYNQSDTISGTIEKRKSDISKEHVFNTLNDTLSLMKVKLLLIKSYVRPLHVHYLNLFSKEVMDSQKYIIYLHNLYPRLLNILNNQEKNNLTKKIIMEHIISSYAPKCIVCKLKFTRIISNTIQNYSNIITNHGVSEKNLNTTDVTTKSSLFKRFVRHERNPCYSAYRNSSGIYYYYNLIRVFKYIHGYSGWGDDPNMLKYKNNNTYTSAKHVLDNKKKNLAVDNANNSNKFHDEFKNINYRKNKEFGKSDNLSYRTNQNIHVKDKNIGLSIFPTPQTYMVQPAFETVKLHPVNQFQRDDETSNFVEPFTNPVQPSFESITYSPNMYNTFNRIAGFHKPLTNKLFTSFEQIEPNKFNALNENTKYYSRYENKQVYRYWEDNKAAKEHENNLKWTEIRDNRILFRKDKAKNTEINEISNSNYNFISRNFFYENISKDETRRKFRERLKPVNENDIKEFLLNYYEKSKNISTLPTTTDKNTFPYTFYTLDNKIYPSAIWEKDSLKNSNSADDKINRLHKVTTMADDTYKRGNVYADPDDRISNYYGNSANPNIKNYFTYPNYYRNHLNGNIKTEDIINNINQINNVNTDVLANRKKVLDEIKNTFANYPKKEQLRNSKIKSTIRSVPDIIYNNLEELD